MTTPAQEAETATAIATASALATEVILRMPRNKISQAVDGTTLTRSSLLVTAQNAVSAMATQQREPAVQAV